MSIEFDNEGFGEVVADAKKLDGHYSRLYDRLKEPDVKQFYSYDKGGRLEEAISRFTEQYQRIQTLEETLVKYRQMRLDALDKGRADMDGIANPEYACPSFSDIVVKPYTDSYPKYRSYQFLQSGKSFSKNYNDIGKFMDSKLFRYSSGYLVGSQKLTDFITWFDTGKSCFTKESDYTNSLADNALMSVLDGLSLAGTEVFSGAVDFVENSLGISTLEDWIKYVTSTIKTLAAAGKPGLEILGSLEETGAFEMFKNKYLRQAAHKLLQMILNEDSWQEMYDFADSVGNCIQLMDWIDVGIECVSHYLTDYSAQLSYLDSMEDALFSAGYYNATYLIGRVRLDYEDSIFHAAKKIGQEAANVVIGNAVKEAGKSVSGLGLASTLIKTHGTATKLFNYEELNADESLMGLCQFDGALTRAYESHIQRMKDGVATQEDMEKADRLFTLLVATKKKEYQSMMAVTKGTMDYDKYKAKYDELLALENPSSSGEGGDSGGLFGAMNDFFSSTAENISGAVKKVEGIVKESQKAN